ncbi:MAG: hypothetical protein R3C03_10325 [Pirellulaceae bacterium]
MSSGTLLDLLTQSGLVDEKILSKLRREIENPEKNVKPAAIVKFLIDKGHLTKDQGKKFLSGEWSPPKQLVDDPQFVVKDDSKERDYDTDDLTSVADNKNEITVPVVRQVTEEIDVSVPEMGTRVFGSSDIDASDDVEIGVDIQQTIVPGMGGIVNSPVDPFAGTVDTVETVEDEGYDEEIDDAFEGKKNQADQWKTKWLYVGFTSLAILMIVGAALILAVFQAEPEELYKAAEDSYVNGTFGDAMTKFRDFHTRFPKNDKASKARVREVQSMIWLPFNSKNLNEVYKVAIEKIPTIENEPEYGIIKEDYAIWFPQVVLYYSEKALEESTVEGMETALKTAEDSKQILAFMTGAQKTSPNAAPVLENAENNLLTVAGLIEKEKDYGKALIDISNGGGESNPSSV